MVKETRRLGYWEVAARISVLGRLHATTPIIKASQEYMVEKTPTEPQFTARRAAGEPMRDVETIAEHVEEDTEAVRAIHPEEQPLAAFRRDHLERPYIHSNFFKGHLRDAAAATSRAIGFWGFQTFVTQTLFITPYRTYLPADLTPQVEEWATHFEVYRMGRLTGLRRAEWVESPVLDFELILTADPRWTAALLEDLFTQGSVMGMGGARRTEQGKYSFELGPLKSIDSALARKLIADGVTPKPAASA